MSREWRSWLDLFGFVSGQRGVCIRGVSKLLSLGHIYYILDVTPASLSRCASMRKRSKSGKR